MTPAFCQQLPAGPSWLNDIEKRIMAHNKPATRLTKGAVPLAKKGLMSDALKEQLARDLGVADLVRREGWGAVPARDCGNLVKLAIQRAENLLKQ